MKILVDNQVFYDNSKYGIKNYFDNLLDEISKEKDIEVIRTPYVYILNKKISYLLNTIISIIYLISKKYDIFQPTYYNNYFLKYVKKQFPVIIYDMIPEYYNLDNSRVIIKKKELINKTNYLICISKQTKTDLLKKYETIDKNKIKVIYPAGSITEKTKPIKIEGLEKQKLILYVGNREQLYKSFLKMVQVLSNEIKINNFTLLCVGGGSFSKKEKDIFKELKITSNVKQINAKPEELKWAYQNSLVFIYPSVVEGFGLPIVEAMSCECLTICSDNNAFKEIAMNNSVVFFDKNDFNDLLIKFKKTITMSKDKIDKIKYNALLNSKNYSWSKSAKELKKVYLEMYQ